MIRGVAVMEKFLSRMEKARRREAAKRKLAERIKTSGVFAIDPEFVTTEIRMAALLNLPPSTILTIVRNTDERPIRLGGHYLFRVGQICDWVDRVLSD